MHYRLRENLKVEIKSRQSPTHQLIASRFTPSVYATIPLIYSVPPTSATLFLSSFRSRTSNFIRLPFRIISRIAHITAPRPFIQRFYFFHHTAAPIFRITPKMVRDFSDFLFSGLGLVRHIADWHEFTPGDLFLFSHFQHREPDEVLEAGSEGVHHGRVYLDRLGWRCPIQVSRE